MSVIDSTNLFGMHSNADVTCSRNAANTLFENLQKVMHHWGGGAGGSEKINITEGVDLRKLTKGDTVGGAVALAAKKMQGDFPEDLNKRHANSKHTKHPGGRYSDALTTVLFQEVDKFNRLLWHCRDTLERLLMAVVGQIPMSEELDRCYNCIDMKR